MRAGYAVSVIGHLAILGIGYFGLPNADPFQAEAIDALPVELVTVADMTDLLEGDKKAEELPTEAPQPKPEVMAEAPSPKPAEEPAEKPVEAAEAPPEAPPPAPEPKVEPEPEPEPEQVASLPEPAPEPPPEPEAEPLPEPEPKAAAEPAPPRVPKARPKPPKPVTAAKPEPKKPEPKEDPLRELALKTGEEFNPDDISALLNKQAPTGGGDPTPATEPQTLGSTTGSVDAAMTQSWLAALTSKLAQCWQPPIGVREAQNLLVSVEFRLQPDGTLSGAPVVLNAGYDPLFQVAAETAVRAVARCEPYGDIFPPEHYGIWGQSITVDFDPRQMFGAG